MAWELLKMQSLWPLSGSIEWETLGIWPSNLGKQPFRQFWYGVKFESLYSRFLFYILLATFYLEALICQYFLSLLLFFCLHICLPSTLKNLVHFLKYLVGLSAISIVNIKPCLFFLCLPNYFEFCIQLLMQFRISVPSSKHWLGQLCSLSDLWNCRWLIKPLKCRQGWFKEWFRMCHLSLNRCFLILRKILGTEEIVRVSGQSVIASITILINYLQNVFIIFFS